MSDRFTALLSDYLDHDLPRAEVEALERHLDDCPECRDTLAGLAAVKSRAAALVDPPAPDDLWAGIASRIGAPGPTSRPRPVMLSLPRRSRAWGVPQWAAAAAAFVVVAAGALWLATGGPGAMRDRTSAGPVAGSTTVGVDASAAAFDPERIEGEIHDLQTALERGRGRLAPETVQVLEENLRVIHKALDEARAALAQDPANRELKDYLAGSVQRKLDLVRRAADLAGV